MRAEWCFDMNAAPRDGSEIIAGCSRIADGFQQVVYWDDDTLVPGWNVKDSDAIYPFGFFDCWQSTRPAPGIEARQGGDNSVGSVEDESPTHAVGGAPTDPSPNHSVSEGGA